MTTKLGTKRSLHLAAACGLVALTGLAGASCIRSEQMIVVAPANPVAVGAHMLLAGVDLSCDETGVTSFVTSLSTSLAYDALLTYEGHLALPDISQISTGTSCRQISVQRVIEVTSSNPAVIEVGEISVDQGVGLVELKALGEGLAVVRMVVETEKGQRSEEAVVHTARVGRVKLTSNCATHSADPDYVAVGAVSSYTVELTQADGKPIVSYDYLPLEPTDLQIMHPTQTDTEGHTTLDYSYINITWPDQAGDVTLTSPDDPSLHETVTLYDSSAYTAVELDKYDQSAGWSLVPVEGTSLVANGEGLQVVLVGQTGSRTSCWGDTTPRHYVTETPDVCQLQPWIEKPPTTEATTYDTKVLGVAPGTCRIRGDFPGTSLSATVELPVN